MITACRATSIRRRGSSRLGKNEPDRSLGILTSTSPAVVDTVLGRVPARRWFGCRCADSGRHRSSRGLCSINQRLQHRREHHAHHPDHRRRCATPTKAPIGQPSRVIAASSVSFWSLLTEPHAMGPSNPGTDTATRSGSPNFHHPRGPYPSADRDERAGRSGARRTCGPKLVPEHLTQLSAADEHLRCGVAASRVCPGGHPCPMVEML